MEVDDNKIFNYICLDCKNEFILKNKPRNNRFSGLCKKCSSKKASLKRIAVNNDGTKMCKKCQKIKPATTDFFLLDKKGYFYPYCRECNRLKCKNIYVPSSRVKLSDDELKNNAKTRYSQFKINRWATYLLNTAKGSARRKNLEIDIDESFILELYEKQNGLCYWFQIPLVPSDVHRDPRKPSIDRLDPKKGYVKDNIVIACMCANIGRSDCDSDIFEEFARSIGKKYE
jgi:DNA-directed RNA polymerase subunit RPC12/RpoP